MKPRKTPPKEGVGSGCMARLVRCSSFFFNGAALRRRDQIKSVFAVGLVDVTFAGNSELQVVGGVESPSPVASRILIHNIITNSITHNEQYFN